MLKREGEGQRSVEAEKMVRGELYMYASDPELVEAHVRAREMSRAYSALEPRDQEGRMAMLKELLGKVGERVIIEAPFTIDFGRNTTIGNDVGINYGAMILDEAPVVIGNNVLFGPGVQVYTAAHPTDPDLRNSGPEFSKPVRIGNGVWIGGRSVICPGVTIGDNTTIGAGSVVTRDIPANVVAAGNPCRVIRKL